MKTERLFNPGLAGLLILVSSWNAFSAEGERSRIVIGEATENYLQLQRDGSSAGRAQPINGEVASRSYQRYLKTFNEPMSQARGGAGSESKPATTSTGTR